MADEPNLGQEPEPQSGLTDPGTAEPEPQAGAEPASGVEPGTEPGTEPGAEPEPKKEQFVPLAALHEERGKRKELAAKLEETTLRSAAEMAKLTERTNIILQAIQQATAEPQGSKDPLFIQQFMAANPGVSKEQAEEAFLKEEPNNYLKYRQDQLAEQHKVLEQRTAKQDEAAKSQEQFSNFMMAYQAKTTEFASQTPDFREAYTFLLTNRDAELQQMGFTDPVQRQQIMRNEEIGIVDQAFKNGVNPAKRIYDIAKFRGYKMVAAQPGTDKQPATLDPEKKNAAATKSLGSVPGSPAGTVNAETLLNMSEADFAKVTSGDNWAKFFRGELKS